MLRKSERKDLLPEEFMLDFGGSIFYALRDAFIGDTYSIIKGEANFILTEGYDLARQHDDLAEFSIGPTWQSFLPKIYVLTGSQKDLRKVGNYGEELAKTSDPAARIPQAAIANLFKKRTIVNMQDKEAMDQRRIAKEHLTSANAVSEAFETALRLSDKLFSEWNPGNSLTATIGHLCTTVVAQCVIGIPEVKLQYLDIIKEAEQLLTNPSTTETEKNACKTKLDWMIGDFVDNHYQEIIAANKFATKTIDYSEQDTPEELKAKLKAEPLDAALLAGSGLSYISVYAAAMLSAHPDVCDRLRSELADSNWRDNPTTLRNLPYLNQVFFEILRMTSPNALLARKTSVKHTIKLANGKEITPPKGSFLFVPVRRIHHDPDFWPQPHIFNPDRFEGKTDRGVLATEHFLPFSYGARSCPAGSHFVDVVFKALIANLVSNYEFKLDKPLETIPVTSLNPRLKEEYFLELEALDQKSSLKMSGG